MGKAAENEVRAQLEVILSSTEFSGAEQLSRFLRFVVEESLAGRAVGLKESLIGVEVFGREPGYDPAADPIVRVRAGRLRAKLLAYYAGEGQTAPVLIEIRKGGYAASFRLRAEKPPVRKRWLAVAAVGLTVAAAAGLFWWWHGAAVPVSHSPPTIAVLPFLNLTGDASVDSTADGLAEELTTALAAAPGLRVVARTSAFQFRGGRDARAVGRQLGSRLLIEGSVRRQGGKLAVNAQLVDTANGYHLSARRYERPASQVYAVVPEMAEDTLRTLRLSSPLRGGTSADPEAGDLFVRARYLERQAGPDAKQKAIECYRQAVAKDERFARAWAALAVAHGRRIFRNPQGGDAGPARIAATRALELDDTQAEAHLALALAACWRDRDWPEAESRFRRTLDLEPSNAYAHQSYGLALMAHGRPEEAVAEARTALDLDPLSYGVSNDLAVALYCARRYDEAIRRCRVALATTPHNSMGRYALATALAGRRSFGEAETEIRQVIAAHGELAALQGRLGYIQASAGKIEEARATLRKMEAAAEPDRGYIYEAMVCLGLGERDKALADLARAAARREPDILFLDADPVWDPVRADPRFQALRQP
jgi:serine/threonine-protein kinase